MLCVVKCKGNGLVDWYGYCVGGWVCVVIVVDGYGVEFLGRGSV